MHTTISTKPSRIMALDLGDRRIGVAVTNALGTAQPLMTVYRKAPRADLKSIARLIRKHDVAEVVVGKPLHMSGEAGQRAHQAEAFAAELGAAVAIPVHLFDERLTTWEAQQFLNATIKPPRSAADRRALDHVIDQAAAVLILQSFLETREAERARRDC
jgi:putative Holliday junction resolvase